MSNAPGKKLPARIRLSTAVLGGHARLLLLRLRPSLSEEDIATLESLVEMRGMSAAMLAVATDKVAIIERKLDRDADLPSKTAAYEAAILGLIGKLDAHKEHIADIAERLAACGLDIGDGSRYPRGVSIVDYERLDSWHDEVLSADIYSPELIDDQYGPEQ